MHNTLRVILVPDGNGAIEIDSNPSDSLFVTVYARPGRYAALGLQRLGQLADTSDQYGGVTSYVYDGNGNKIETIYPNGTETLSASDPDNRVIWTTNQFYPGGPNAPILTHTIFNALGQQTETDTFDGGRIQITSQNNGGSMVYVASVATSGIVTPDGGTFVSSSKSFYDAAGHDIETI